ncbi:MAG: recombination-associated protein RdgC [Pseudomonadota bacterium]|nr:recombination-associated protein RdgC [Pseudomonadota bacterium]
MLFRNVVFYRLPMDWSPSAAELEDRLASRPLRPCGPYDMSTDGWVNVTHGGRLLHTVGQHQMIALGVDDKLLPASIVRQVALERADAQAREQGFPVGRKQMRDLRSRVADELRTRALTRRRVTRAWFDRSGGWLAIDSPSAKTAERIIETLRATLGSFVPRPLESDQSPRATMASWLLRGAAAGPFSIDDDLELQSADQTKTVIRYLRHPLDGREVRGHIAAGKFPTRLGLTWKDRISFVLTERLEVKRVEFLELQAETAAADEADPDERFDLDFAVMAGELGVLLADLAAALTERRGDEAAWPAQSKVA